ncbi:MAG: CBS domain-containing protein [Dehalococcoidales bacterium]
MLVRDIMTADVVTIPGNTSVIEAKRLMDKKELRRLPVVDKGKLVGIVTSKRLAKVAPTPMVSNNMWDIAFSIVSSHQVPVRQIMETDVVTVNPLMTVEEALALAQARKVGGLVVVDKDNKIAGIVTTNDFFYRIVNKVLGVGEPGERIWVADGGESKALEDIIAIINKHCLEIITLHIIAPPRKKTKDIVVHINCDDVSKLVDDISSKGFEVEVRKR